jgi:hypothetical protein
VGRDAGMKSETDDKRAPLAIKIIFIFICILLLPIILIAAIIYYSWSLILSIAMWIFWNLRGRDVLFVYSNSPVWSDYIEQKILPNISGRAIVLNWSERKQWKPSLAVLVFKRFSGTREFNPIAIVFRPFRLHKIFRFYEEFKDFKHGKTENLERKRMNFFKAVEI